MNPDFSSTRVLVVGLGYVGLPLALRAVDAGYHVTGVEVDHKRLGLVQAGLSYIEDIDDAALATAIATGRFDVASAIGHVTDFDIAIVAVPTPLRDRAPDLAYVIEASRELGRILKKGACVVLESTTYPGTTQDVVVPLLEEVSGLRAGVDFQAGFSPERIDPGNKVWTLNNTPKIVSGIDEASLERIAAFYGSIVTTVVRAGSPKVAELAKLLENTYRHVNIALINELAIFAFELGIDIWDVVDVASSKPFGFQRFTPGPGVGGHCLPIDPSYLSWQVLRQLGHPFRFVELANDVNEHMPDYVVRRIQLALNEQGLAVKGARILLLGIAYKKNSGDARESPAVRVGELLGELGADLRVADPLVVHDVSALGRRVDVTTEELSAADLVVVLTDHDAFDWDLVIASSRHIFDTRNRLRGESVERI